MSKLVIPDPDELGVRVTPRTPLGHIVGALRKHNPLAKANDLIAAAMQLQRQPRQVPSSEAQPEVVTEPQPAPKAKARRRRTEADSSMVDFDGGAPIPAEPPNRW